jgi:hypothetical protein
MASRRKIYKTVPVADAKAKAAQARASRAAKKKASDDPGLGKTASGKS